jgi:hypothetical protein
MYVWHNVVERSVTASDYNHREAQNVLMSVPADMTRGDGETPTVMCITTAHVILNVVTKSRRRQKPVTSGRVWSMNVFCRADHNNGQ